MRKSHPMKLAMFFFFSCKLFHIICEIPPHLFLIAPQYILQYLSFIVSNFQPRAEEEILFKSFLLLEFTLESRYYP